MDIALRRTGLDLQAAFTLAAYAAVATGLVLAASVLLEGPPLVVVLAALVIVWLLHLALYAFSWRQARRVTHPLGLHSDGVHGRSPVGGVVAPWAAVASAKVEFGVVGRMIRVRLVPPGDPARAGLTSTAPPRMMKALDRRGMRFRLRFLDADLEELRRAFVVQSSGRVQLS